MRHILSALAAVITIAMSATLTFSPAHALELQCEPGETAEDCLVRLRVFAATLVDENSALERRIDEIQTSAAKTNPADKAEIERLERELATAIIERDQARRDLETAQGEISRLREELEGLSGKVERLEESVRELLELREARPVADEAPAPGLRPQAPAVVLASSPRSPAPPPFDPSVYGRTGYRDFEPARPSPIAHPEVRGKDAGNRQVFTNEQGHGETSPYVFLQLPGVRNTVDPSGYTSQGEVLLGPGQTHTWYAEGETRAMLTPAWVSTAPSATREWDGRQWVSIQRASGSCHIKIPLGQDYDYGRFSCTLK